MKSNNLLILLVGAPPLIQGHCSDKDRRRFGEDNENRQEAFTTKTKKDNNKKIQKEPNVKFKGKCYNCGRFGHRAIECTKPAKRKERLETADSMESSQTVFTSHMLAVSHIEPDEWIFDSGASVQEWQLVPPSRIGRRQFRRRPRQSHRKRCEEQNQQTDRTTSTREFIRSRPSAGPTIQSHRERHRRSQRRLSGL